MNRLLVLFFLAMSLTGKSQLEDNRWYFSSTSTGMFFDFSTNAVSVTNEHQGMAYGGGYCTANDPVTGALLFYTDGNKVWDKLHGIMPNSTGLLNGTHILQSGISCSNPGHPGQFYVFSSTGENPNAGSIYYSIVDLSLPGNGTSGSPRGNVVSGAKNILVTNQATEGMMVIPGKANYHWLIVPQINSNNVKVFLINQNGISLKATYNLGYNVGVVSQTRYSKAAGKIAIVTIDESKPGIIMNFNDQTGVISGAFTIPSSSYSSTSSSHCGNCDCEWSPDGTKLYIARYRNCSSSSSGTVLQYDLNSPTNAPVPICSVTPNSYTNLSKGLKLAPNGKIYHIYNSGSSSYIGSINSPNIAGTSCNYTPNAVPVTLTTDLLHKLPEFLFPLTCTSSTEISDTAITANWDCLPNDHTNKRIGLLPISSNPCTEPYIFALGTISYGTAIMENDSTILYTPPSSYVSADTVHIIMNTFSGSDTAHIIINYLYTAPTQPVISTSWACLESNYTSGNQWLLNGTLISGATSQVYCPSQPGNYSLLVHVGNCQAFSDTLYFDPTSISTNDLNGAVVWPNPAHETVSVLTSEIRKITVMDITGRTLIVLNNLQSNQVEIGTGHLSPGTYIVRIETNGAVMQSKLFVE
jgi:hypothetical protein